jgi:peptidoglycan/xylan/chitin deacetylase (PgdA/CDA1 family)
VGLLLVTAVQGAYVIEIDTDGRDDGILTYNADFSFGGDTTLAFQSAASAAIGLSGADSIYGGNGLVNPDTYIYTYSPDAQVDNLFLSPGTPLGDWNYASGATGGGAGRYAIYVTWPATSNVDGGLTHFQIETTGDSVSTSLDQNGSGGYGSSTPYGNVWVKLGEVDYTSGPITVTQTPTLNTAVSMRSAGVLFELVSGGQVGGYTGPPGCVIFGQGAQQFLGLAFVRNKTLAQTNHFAVLRGTDLEQWSTSDLKLFSVTNINAGDELVTFHSMTPMRMLDREFLRVRIRPKMPVFSPYYVAITFDDGPHPDLTPRLLDILAERNIRATFFVVGNNAQKYRHILRRAINEGHEIGNHTMTHARLTDLSDAEVVAEVAGCRDAIVAAATVPPSAIRPPYGAVNNRLRNLFLREFGYPTILWNIDPRDWDATVSDDEVITTIIDGVADWFSAPVPDTGPIILMHDIHERTIQIVPTILDALLAQGYSFVTVSELLALQAN